MPRNMPEAVPEVKPYIFAVSNRSRSLSPSVAFTADAFAGGGKLPVVAFHSVHTFRSLQPCTSHSNSCSLRSFV